MTPLEVVVAVAVGLGAGVLSGLFGVGGGIVMTPGIQTLVGTTPIVSLATPLPVIFPTAIAGALRYRSAGELDMRAARWLAAIGIPSAIAGALATEIVPTDLLLAVTAALMAWQAVGLIRGTAVGGAGRPERATPARFAATGLAAGFVSGLLGIGGGLVMVPLMARWMGMPLKRALGTSLAAIVGMVVPGTIVHAALGNVAWNVAAALAVGAVPGARLGAHIALGTRERTLRVLVGSFLLVVAAIYGARQLVSLAGG
jgi:uncharacterized membrane protein YfcA